MKIFNLPSFSFKSISIKSISMPFNINLQRREKMAVTAAAIALGIFLLLQIVVFPVIDRDDELLQQIKTKTQALQEMQDLQAEYVSLSRYSSGVESGIKKRPGNFTLFSFIDKLAGTSGIKGNIAYMKPSTSNLKNSSYTLSTVEIKLNALTMEQLTAFLYGIEESPNMVWIRRLSISKSDNNQSLLNSVLQVETFEL
jgi:general secretion pathway protein M